MDYEPLDLTEYCNAGVDVYDPAQYRSGGSYLMRPETQKPPTGLQQFYGLPFQIGSVQPAEINCLLAFGKEVGLRRKPLHIFVNKTARHLLFAHAVLETQLWRGGPLGVRVAQYIFHYENHPSISVPIRERFEIGNFPLPWGQYPFLCVADQPHHLEPRYDGRWENAGFRQTELKLGVPRGYFIWVWVNPHPDQVISHIEIVPQEQKLVLAAITLGHVDEYPLVRAARRPVKITLLDEANAHKPFDLSIEVNRGTATYPYPLPDTSLTDADPDMRGFGSPANKNSSPAYTFIAAVPSATVRVKQGDDDLGDIQWGELETNGVVETPRARLEIIDPGKNWIKIQVIDEDTGQPIACRVAFHSQEGVPYAPHGHHAPVYSNLPDWNIDIGGDLVLGQVAYAYINGACEGWLPRGRVLVDVARGYEYEPLRTWVEIEPGQQQLTLRLKRWIDMNAQHYFSGDTHVHFLSSQGSQTEASGEDLNVVNLLQSQWGHLFTNTEEFTGRPHLSQDGKTIVYVSQENRQHILGHLSLLGLKEPVYPWATGGATEAELGGGLDITMSHWADETHKQGGTVILPHLPTPNAEAAVLIATGRADAVEMFDFLEYEHLEYYRYLNGGYRLPLVGGTDKMSSGIPVGLYRTYVHLSPNEEFNYENWCRALRAGHTFLSSGALIWFSIEGQPIGSTLHVNGGGTVEITARAQSIFPLHTLQIVQQGHVIAETKDENGARSLSLTLSHKIEKDTWLAARCAGPDYTAIRHYDDRRRGVMAHTSPIYITCGDEYALLEPKTAHYMLTLISGGLSYIRHHSPQHNADDTTFHHGLADHIGYLEEPFHEAAEAIHRRMHQLGIPH